MSELDLIKKLERLSNAKPNKEWVNFTRNSILSSNPETQKQGFLSSFNFGSLAPMMVCVFVALIFGSFVNLTSNNEIENVAIAPENSNIDSEDFKMPAIGGAIKNQEGAPQVSSLPKTVENTPVANGNEDALILDNIGSLSVIFDENDRELAIREINNRIERIKNEVKECRKLDAQGLLDEDEKTKERCDAFEDQLNYFEQILGE